MNADENRLIGSITAQLESLAVGQSKIFEKLDELSTRGCALGREYERRITVVEQRPDRFVSMGAGIVAVLGAIVTWIHSGK
jgi:hypothetical protein